MFIIEILKSIIYGIVEGITEWLPISSTGHLILIQDFIKYKNENPAFMEMFNVVIQLGAILAVVVIYFDKLNPFKPGKTARQDDWFEAHFYNLVSVAIMLIIYGAAFIYLEKREQVEPTVTELSRLPYQTALYIGRFQVLSLFPGTSRSGATIVGGLLNGVSRPVVTEFTFYLGIPIMFGASGLKILKFIIKGNSLGFDQLFLLLVAMGVAFGVSLYVIRFLTDYVKNHDFTIFGKYRIGLGVLLLVYGLIKVIIG